MQLGLRKKSRVAVNLTFTNPFYKLIIFQKWGLRKWHIHVGLVKIDSSIKECNYERRKELFSCPFDPKRSGMEMGLNGP